MINEEFIYIDWGYQNRSVKKLIHPSVKCHFDFAYFALLVCVSFNWLFLSTPNEYVRLNGSYSVRILFICITEKAK